MQEANDYISSYELTGLPLAAIRSGAPIRKYLNIPIGTSDPGEEALIWLDKSGWPSLKIRTKSGRIRMIRAIVSAPAPNTMKFTIQFLDPPAPGTDYSFTLPLGSGTGYTYCLEVDWGDSSIEIVVPESGNDPTHVYPSAAGTFQITLKGHCEHFAFPLSAPLSTDPVKVISWDEITGDSSHLRVFRLNECVNLTSLPVGMFDLCTSLVSFEGTFRGCSGLISLPPGLFDQNIKARYFIGTFEGCSGLFVADNPGPWFYYDNYGNQYFTYVNVAIPEDLFAYNILAVSFERTFKDAAFNFAEGLVTIIPANLFANNVLATCFDGTFEGISTVSFLPDSGLFDHNVAAISFDRTFANLLWLNRIPANLFQYNVAAVSFKETFRTDEGVSYVKVIPSTLFSRNVAAESFEGTFRGQTFFHDDVYNDGDNPTIPPGLFDFNILAKSFKNTFRDCLFLHLCPIGLFDHNILVESFEGTFRGCWSLGTIPDNFILYNSKVRTFKDMYYWCVGLGSLYWNYNINIPGGSGHDFVVTAQANAAAQVPPISLITEGCFYKATLDDRFEIPVDWK